ncbi:MAG: DUF115 domain-containing protein [Treponema sp.]|nr:DUF115 domain-containing protein [Treponema sp.]
MPELNNEKPCLVKSGQGFSVLYKNRYLYSRYAPAKNILAAVDSFNILPGTLILACSPCLGFGLSELAQKLPENCMILGCECDTELFNLAREHITGKIPHFALLKPSELSVLPVLLNKYSAAFCDGTELPPPGTFRRAVRIDFSAGTQFSFQYYAVFSHAVEDAIGLFWKNRITLVKFGRKYSRNLFRNLSRLPYAPPAEYSAHTVFKPLLVLGAGESMENTAAELIPFRSKFYIISVDTAFPALRTLGITPDAVVCEEAQSVIASAFFGIKGRNITIFAGITSWPGLYDFLGKQGQISYFAPKYADTVFFERLVRERILPEEIPPLGSVGLTAVYLALQLRINDRIPVFVSGLDFSYSPGKTHVRGAPAHTVRLSGSIRTLPAANYGAAFGYGASENADKAGNRVYSTPVLLSYAQSFRGLFYAEKNVFDTGKTGIALGLPYRSISSVQEDGIISGEYTGIKAVQQHSPEKSSLIADFYNTEENALLELRNILSYGQNMNEELRNKRITELLTPREYLYLHFPDGYRLSLSPSFLKRIRAEIDLFLKDINTGKKLLFCSR